MRRRGGGEAAARRRRGGGEAATFLQGEGANKFRGIGGGDMDASF